MRPTHLRARNFRTYPELDLEFGTGVVGVLGELRDAPEGSDSNGSGKSSILEAIDIALFGRRSLAGYLTRGGEVDELMVELTFDHAGETYRVRRSYSAKGRGKTSVDLEVWNGSGVGMTSLNVGTTYSQEAGTWEPLTRASAKETDAYLCDLIGLSQDTFRDSSYLRQGDGGYADPDRDPKQRKQLLVEAVLGRDPIWPRLADAAKTRRRDAETRIERLLGESQTLRDQAAGADAARQQVKDAEDAVVATAAALSEAEARHQAVIAEIAADRERLAARQAAVAEWNVAGQELARLEERLAEATRAEKDIVDTRHVLFVLATPERLAELEARETLIRKQIDDHAAACATHDRALADHRAATTKLTDLRNRAAEAYERVAKFRYQAAHVLEADAATCDRCGQALGAEAAAHTAASLRVEADKLADHAKQLEAEAELVIVPDIPEEPVAPEGRDELAALHQQVQVARTQQQERARCEERLAQLAKTVAAKPTDIEVADARHMVATKRHVLDSLPDTVSTLDDTETAAAVDAARARREEAVAQKARADERLAATLQARSRLAVIDDEIAGHRITIDRDLLLEKAYGRDGIPALIIENTAIPSIEAEASRILRALGTGFDVQLRTQRETQAGGLKDTLDVVVIDPDGNEADYADGCSGGEQTRIGLALRIALARLLANRRGAESRLLALDEPSYLDAAGMNALLDVLRGLETEFDVILLVSHVAELRDAIEDVIVVVKEAGVSRVEGALVAEQVAA